MRAQGCVLTEARTKSKGQDSQQHPLDEYSLILAWRDPPHGHDVDVGSIIIAACSHKESRVGPPPAKAENLRPPGNEMQGFI